MIPPDDIFELELECSTLCNAKCPLCYRNYVGFRESPYRAPTERGLSETIRQLEMFKNLRFVMLVGSMSEPTLYTKFIELVEYLKKRRIRIEVCTNGDTRDEAFWRRLGQTLDDTDAVYFTICGARQKIHETYRRGTNVWRIARNARYLRSERPVDYAQCIRFAYNSRHLDSNEFRGFISQFSHVYMTETFYPKPQSNYFERFDEGLFLPCAEKISEYDKLKAFAERNFENGAGKPSDCMCRRTNRFQMDVFGNIYPCYLYLESSNGVPWDGNKDDIMHVNRDCCKFCDLIVQKYAKRHNLEYVI